MFIVEEITFDIFCKIFFKKTIPILINKRCNCMVQYLSYEKCKEIINIH